MMIEIEDRDWAYLDGALFRHDRRTQTALSLTNGTDPALAAQLEGLGRLRLAVIRARTAQLVLADAPPTPKPEPPL